MIGAIALRDDTIAHSRWRLIRSYVLARRLPGYWLLMVILLAMVLWGRGWATSHAPISLQMLVFLLPAATASVVGVSLWSPFGEIERAAGTLLPLGRSLHLLSMLVIALLINRVAAATWVPDDVPGVWETYLLRHTAALVGVSLLLAHLADARLSWIGPALVAMPGLVTGYIRMEVAEAEGRQIAFFHDSWHPMLHPVDSVLAASVAVVLCVGGITVLMRRGERLVEPEESAG